MTTASTPDLAQTDAAFRIVRTFRASRARVWRAWSAADQLQRWWGPAGCGVDVHRFEFRPGGFFHYAMTFGGAPPMWGRFNYREIVAEERIVWLNSFSNGRGGIARAPFSADCPLEILNTAEFAEADGATTVTLVAEPFGEDAGEREYFRRLRPSLDQGYGGTFDQLDALLGRA